MGDRSLVVADDIRIESKGRGDIGKRAERRRLEGGERRIDKDIPTP
ncbi:MAG: hypothetical protein ISN28_05510 [Ectothiorhodospiraceae bacterium AqS1]|nr:hypothetical protein [Ectothiorhodospiraceae bacterium AqS1]